MVMTRFLWPIPGRIIVAGCMWVVALGRFGLYAHASGSLASDTVYGLLFVAGAVALALTHGRYSLRWPGRTVAIVCTGLLTTLATDLFVSTGGNNTSTMMLIWLSVVLIVQAGARREC